MGNSKFHCLGSPQSIDRVGLRQLSGAAWFDGQSAHRGFGDHIEGAMSSPRLALRKAEECMRQARLETDPERRLAWQRMFDLWLGFANQDHELSANERRLEFQRLADLQKATCSEPTPRAGGAAGEQNVTAPGGRIA